MQLLLQKATRQHTRDHNRRLVLRAIYDQGEISRADLARITQLTRTTISEVVGSLIELGLVEELGFGPSAGGRSPIILRIVDDSRHLIGISLTSNSVHGAILSLRGDIRHKIEKPLAQSEGALVYATACTVIDELISASTSPLIGIGISTPGLIDTSSGIVQRAFNFNWYDFPLGPLLHKRCALPIYVANDSHTTALAEYVFGSGQGLTNLAVLRVGQGVGAGLILNGQLYCGDAYGAGEIGHVVAVENGLLCKCGNKGCLETVVGANAIIRMARDIAYASPHSIIHQLCPSLDALTFSMIVQAFQAGDPAINPIITQVGRYLGLAVANIIGILNIRHIIVTGRIAVFGTPLANAIRLSVQSQVLPTLATQTTIEVIHQGSDSTLQGAAALLLTNELGLGQLGGPLNGVS